jgi:prevent-host-death family protein
LLSHYDYDNMTIVMRQKIAAGAFKAQCLGLLDEVQQQRIEIVITKRGRPVARLVPIGDDAPAIFGRLKGSGRIVGDISSTGESWEADA